MDWGLVDEKLIRHGEPLLSLDFLEGYDFEPSLLNDGREARFSHNVQSAWGEEVG